MRAADSSGFHQCTEGPIRPFRSPQKGTRMNRRRVMVATVAGTAAVALIAACSSSKSNGGPQAAAKLRARVSGERCRPGQGDPARLHHQGRDGQHPVRRQLRAPRPGEQLRHEPGELGRLIYRTLTFIEDTPAEAGDQARPGPEPGYAVGGQEDLDLQAPHRSEVRGRHADHQ